MLRVQSPCNKLWRARSRLYRSNFSLQAGSLVPAFFVWGAENLAETMENQPDSPNRQSSNRETRLSFNEELRFFRRVVQKPQAYRELAGIPCNRGLAGPLSPEEQRLNSRFQSKAKSELNFTSRLARFKPSQPCGAAADNLAYQQHAHDRLHLTCSQKAHGCSTWKTRRRASSCRSL